MVEVSESLLSAAADWSDLHRWKRAELGRALRRLGLSYGEIQRLIPVPKGTLSDWCRDVRLTPAQIAGIKSRTNGQRGVPRDTQWKRREEIALIEAEAVKIGRDLLRDPLWVAGTALYWGEGAKTKRMLAITNADPAVLRCFIAWVRRFHDDAAEFVLALHLHEGNDERAAKAFWRDALVLPRVAFHKSFIKPAGTGHRKNSLPHGVCRVLTRRSTNAWLRTMVWIRVLGEECC